MPRGAVRPGVGKSDEDSAAFMKRFGELKFRTRVSGAVFCGFGLLMGSAAMAQDSAAQAVPADQTVPATDTPATAQNTLGGSVVITVNDELISTYDVTQRMRLLIVTAGIQPTEQNMPALQQQAARSLIDEHLEMQSLRAEGKTQKFDLVASDAEVNDELADIARSNNTSADQLLAQLAAQGVGADTFKSQLRAEISWRGWIRGRYGSRISVGDDQIKAYLRARYGDFILMKPPLEPATWLLWLGPFLVLAGAGGVAWRVISRAQKVPESADSSVNSTNISQL